MTQRKQHNKRTTPKNINNNKKKLHSANNKIKQSNKKQN